MTVTRRYSFRRYSRPYPTQTLHLLTYISNFRTSNEFLFEKFFETPSVASGGPSMYHPWPSMEFAMTTYKLDPLVARPGPSMAMDGMPWSLSTGPY